MMEQLFGKHLPAGGLESIHVRVGGVKPMFSNTFGFLFLVYPWIVVISLSQKLMLFYSLVALLSYTVLCTFNRSYK